MGDLTKNFNRREFSCPCCGIDHIDHQLVIMLQEVREAVGHALVISSGVRCAKHNKEVGGVKTSAHISGTAVDIVCESSKLRFAIIRAALQSGITRIGVADRFLHIDTATVGKPKFVIWCY